MLTHRLTLNETDLWRRLEKAMLCLIFRFIIIPVLTASNGARISRAHESKKQLAEKSVGF